MSTDDASSAVPPVFDIDPENGCLSSVRFVPSPNRDARPDGAEPELLVIHGISLPPGEFGGNEIEALFTNTLDWAAHPYFEGIRGIEVSAHLLIRRDGAVIQFVPFGERAWHAGESRFHGRTRCNDFSIGIELEGEDETPYEDAQYASLIAVIGAIKQGYPKIAHRNIAGHSDVAPGRKSDPGPAFDWLRLYDGLS